jgi:hypothetical protein
VTSFSKFHFVMLNFLHMGEQRVHLNAELVTSILASVRSLLGNWIAQHLGSVLLTPKMRPPYSRWNVSELAREVGLRLTTCLLFERTTTPNSAATS